MSELVVVVFDDERRADEALIDATRLPGWEEVEFEDAAVAVKTKRGKLTVRQTTDIMPGHRAAPGGWWGLLIGLLIGGPKSSRTFGAAFTSLHDKLTDLGIDKDFIERLRESVEPGTSALFLLLERPSPEGAVEALQDLDGLIVNTTLPEAAFTAVQAVLETSIG